MAAEVIEAPEAELTEFESIDVQKVSGVAQGANGFTHLILKGIPAAEETAGVPDSALMNDLGATKANPGCGCCPDCSMDASKAIVDGKVDQKPDIALGQKILDLLGQAMHNESQEVAAGHHGETGDVEMLAQAHHIVHAWHNGEKTHPDGIKATADDDAAKALAAEEAVYKRKFTAEQRRQLASEGKALSDGSYPIENEEDLHNAASLARSGHGDVAGAKRLIARRAKALGVANPLDDDKDDDASKGVVAEQETTVDDVTQGTDDRIAKAVAAAVTEALKPYEERIKSLGAELAKVKATPLPGGPVLSANARPSAGVPQISDEAAAKAARYEYLAESVSDRDMAAGYAQLARQARQEATTTS